MSQHATTRREKIVCVGDLLVDVWWRVDTAKRNIEHAAVALTSGPSDCKIRAGGAGLFANTAALAGFDVTLFSVADAEPTTERMLAKLSKNVDISHVQIVENFRTPIKTRYINENGHIIVRHDSETADQPDHTNPSKIELAEAAIEAACIVVSDYDKQCIAVANDAYTRQAIVDLAAMNYVPLFVDAKPKHLREYAGADLFKLNRTELEGLVGDQLDFASALRTAATILNTRLLIVTDGSRGVGWCLRGCTGFLASPKKYSSGNCVGAGDTFFAGLLLGFSELQHFDCDTISVEQLMTALKIALVAAGQRVRANGEKPFNPKKILREVNRGANWQQKIVPAAEVAAVIAAKRAQGKRIVLTNGCFDLLHAGHVHLLSFAKQQGDFLIVAVDSDANVRALKGKDRPLQDEQTRAGNLAALAAVDAVCIFEDTSHHNATLIDVISAVMPDVLVKGADYVNKEIVGADVVTGNNGVVALCPLLPNASTTALVNKIRMLT